MGNQKREVAMPHIDPRVTDPKAVAYQQKLKASQGSRPRGGESTPIPRLDAEPEPGMTMSEQALSQRGQRPQTMDSIFGGAPAPSAKKSPILMSDMLPPDAQNDPAFVKGAGSLVAANQPHLVQKYGVLRGGQHIPASELFGKKSSSQKGKLSPETQAGIAAIAEMRRKHQEATDPEKRIEKEAEGSLAAEAAKIGNLPGDDDPRPLSDEERKKLQNTAMRTDDFDFDTLRQMMMKDLLNNPEQKEIIESRLVPMDLGDLVMGGEVRQVVPIVPEVFWVEFRSVSSIEDLSIKRLLVEEAKGVNVDDRHILDKFAIMVLTLGLHAVCGNPLPSHVDDQGKFSEDLFWRKFEVVSRMNIHMVASLGVNYFWYDLRVRKLFVAEKVKNGS